MNTEAMPAQGSVDVTVVPLPASWHELECMHIDSLTKECGMFTSDTRENNGYGCRATQNTEAPGCCHTFACPIATECDEEDPHWCDTYSRGDWMIVHSRFERHNAGGKRSLPKVQRSGIDRCVRRLRSTEKNMEKQKCTVTADGKFVEPCKTLADATEFGNPNGKRKGVWSWEYHSRDKPGPTRRFWGTKSGEFVSKGLAFNYCPFCGEKIDAPFTEPSNAAVSGRGETKPGEKDGGCTASA